MNLSKHEQSRKIKFSEILFDGKHQHLLLQKPIVMWKMKAPEKKPLIRRENLDEHRSRVRKGEQKKKIEPIKALSEFEA